MPHVHATNKTAVAMRAVKDPGTLRSCDDRPVATTSNGDPPPESAFDSWLFATCVGFVFELLDAVFNCGVLTDDVASVAVALGSITIPAEEVLEDCATDVCGAADIDVDVEVVATVCVVDAAACVLVCTVVVADELGVTIVTGVFRHSDAIPRPFWKTPIIDVSPTSTSAQLLPTSCVILLRPCTHALLQIALSPKSSALQPSI